MVVIKRLAMEAIGRVCQQVCLEWWKLLVSPSLIKWLNNFKVACIKRSVLICDSAGNTASFFRKLSKPVKTKEVKDVNTNPNILTVTLNCLSKFYVLKRGLPTNLNSGDISLQEQWIFSLISWKTYWKCLARLGW